MFIYILNNFVHILSFLGEKMKKNPKLENMICEAGQLLGIEKTEVKHALMSRKNIIIAGAITVFAFIVVQSITYGTLRYTGASINDFIQLGKFL